MVSTRKKRLSNRKLLGELDDFYQDIVIDNSANELQDSTVVKEATYDREFTVVTFSNNKVVNESTVNVKTLQRCFSERIDKEMSNIVDKVEDRTQI